MKSTPNRAARSPGSRPKGSILFHLGALVLYIALALWITWPLVLGIKTRIAGFGGDSLIFLWSFWWVKKAILNPELSLFFTDYLFSPGGVSLAFHTLSLFNSISFLPLQSWLGLVGAYNAAILAGFALGGWGAYLLALEVTHHRFASVVAGIIFGFAPYHVSHAMADLNVSSVQFIPFTLLFLLRWRRRGGYAEPVLTGVCLGLTALCHWYYLLYVGMALVILALVHGARSGHWKPSRASIASFLLFVGSAAILILPAAIPMLRAAADTAGVANPGQQSIHSADLTAFVIPSPHHPLFRPWIMPYAERLGGNLIEGTVSLGFVVVALAVIGVWGRKKLTDPARVEWLVLGLVALVLSLGPALRVAGVSLGPSGYLPYRWLIQSVPLVEHARVPARFAVLVVCSASILAAFGLKDLVGRATLRKSASRRNGVLALVSAVVLFEFWAAPFPARPIPVPRVFDALAEDGGEYTILHLPLEEWAATVLAMYYQTHHEKQILTGAVSRVPEGARVTIEEYKEDPFSYSFMIRNRVRYIVLFTPEGIQRWHRQVMVICSRIPWLSRVHADERQVVVYLVEWPSHRSPSRLRRAP